MNAKKSRRHSGSLKKIVVGVFNNKSTHNDENTEKQDSPKKEIDGRTIHVVYTSNDQIKENTSSSSSNLTQNTTNNHDSCKQQQEYPTPPSPLSAEENIKDHINKLSISSSTGSTGSTCSSTCSSPHSSLNSPSNSHSSSNSSSTLTFSSPYVKSSKNKDNFQIYKDGILNLRTPTLDVSLECHICGELMSNTVHTSKEVTGTRLNLITREIYPVYREIDYCTKCKETFVTIHTDIQIKDPSFTVLLGKYVVIALKPEAIKLFKPIY